MKYIFLSFIMMASTALAAKGDAQKARFQVWLQVIEKTLGSSTSTTKVADAFLEENNRVAAFNLQALGKLYTSQDSRFSKMIRENFKDLEDGIGEYDKWNKIAKKSGQAKDRARAEQAKRDFADLLKEEKWLPLGSGSRLHEIKKFLEGFSWASHEEDQQEVLKQISDQLSQISSTKYDVSRLEKRDGDGNGLHELRREIRWFLIEARVLNGAIQFANSQTCSVNQFKELLHSDLVNSKYAQLPGSPLEKNPCLIQQCLFLGLAKSVNVLGQIKDAAEQDKESRETDSVLGENLVAAKKAYRELGETEVFRKLSDNINSCIK